MKKIIAVLVVVFTTVFYSNSLGQKVRTPSLKSATAVDKQEIGSAEAFSDGNGVLLRWKTDSEKALIGFFLYRTHDGQSIRVNEQIVPSSMLTKGPTFGNSGEYMFFDENGSFQNAYSIEGVFSDGRRMLVKSLSARFTDNLLNVAPMTSDAFRQAKETSQPVIESTDSALSESTKATSDNEQSLTDFDRQKWVAAQPGVKIAISKEGLYRVTRAELETAGFNVASPHSFWQLYVNGEEQPLIVEKNGQYIEFYASNFTDTTESGKQIYYLLAGTDPGKRMTNTVGRRIGASVAANSFIQSQTTRERRFYLQQVLNGERQNFFGTFIGDSNANVNFNLKGIDFSVPTTEISVVIQGISLAPHSTRLSLNNVVIGTFSGFNQDSMKYDFTVPTQTLVEGTNTLQFITLNGASDYSLFDSVTVKLGRKYVADQNQLSFYTQNYKTSNVEGFTSPNIRVFDISYPNDATLVKGLTITENAGTFTVNMPSNRARTFYAVADTAIKQADSIVQNTPSTLSIPAHNARMVIITHKNFMTEANAWANYRRADNLSVEVVDVEDIYDEFNYGVLSAKSITDFLQFARSNWTTPPAYVLLIGDATYDPRNFSGGGAFNLVPTRFVDTVYIETGSDDGIVDFNNDGLAEIPIGRLSVRTGAEVTQMLNKVMTFEQSVSQGFSRGALCASDVNQDYNFEALCQRVFNEMPSAVNKTFINRSQADSGTTLLNQLNTGKYIVNYSGHGNITIWGAGNFFSSSTALTMSNGNNLSIFTMLTCLNGYYIEPFASSLSENLLKANNGGAVAAWSSSGLTTPDVQEVMARRFYSQLGAGNMNRIGDLINDAKTVVPGGRDVKLSWVLLGDPALKVR